MAIILRELGTKTKLHEIMSADETLKFNCTPLDFKQNFYLIFGDIQYVY